ncbi:MAG TPA: hypothetical protein VGF67_07395 [Ktedonobacteraceae bacterium]
MHIQQQSVDPGSRDETADREARPGGTDARWLLCLLVCALGLIGCVLLALTTLTRVPDPVVHLHLAAGEILAGVGSGLPLRIGTLSPAHSAALLLVAVGLLAFLCYGLGALLVSRHFAAGRPGAWRSLLWLTTLLAGALLLVTPAMLSHDILVYAGYSRLIATYHANPYFVPIASFPHDPFSPLNYWGHSVAAYGPIWLLVCAGTGVLLPPDPTAYVLTFRLLALVVHLLNTWLIGRSVRTLGGSARATTAGMLLYAWNPLLLLESGLGGHNDGLMMTFVLLGILLAAGAEKRGLILRPRGYLPVVAALSLAVLVKFTALPLLAGLLLFLGCKALRPSMQSPCTLGNWRSALPVVLSALLSALLLALLCYAPLWVGHSLQSIQASFQSPPSALGAENSFMRSSIEWLHLHPAQAHKSLLQLLSTRRLWDDLTLAAIALCLLIGTRQLWFRPEIRTLLVVALVTMCAMLLLTPWFFSWYLTWPLALAALCLPFCQGRVESALLALTFVFSVSALATYPFTLGLAGSHYYLVSIFTTLPPACTFLLTLLCWRPASRPIIGEHG